MNYENIRLVLVHAITAFETVIGLEVMMNPLRRKPLVDFGQNRFAIGDSLRVKVGHLVFATLRQPVCGFGPFWTFQNLRVCPLLLAQSLYRRIGGL